MPLSEDEQRILQEIEQQFYADDPRLAGDISRHSLFVDTVRQIRRAAALFTAGVVVLVVTLATTAPFPVAFGGFLVMLGAALWLERCLRRLGRAGIDELADSLHVPRGRGRRPSSRPDPDENDTTL